MSKPLPQYETIYNDIYDSILTGKYRPGDQLPIEYALCKKYGVSRITIQKALSKLVANEIIVRIIGKGTFVADASEKFKQKKNRLIGVILCNITSSFGTEMLKSIENNASLNGYSIVFKNSNFERELETRAARELLDLGVAGLILQPTHGESFNPEIMKFQLSKKPIILVDRNLEDLACSFVGSDNYSAMNKVMSYLFSNGHRNICFVSSKPDRTSSTEQRIEGFKNEFLKNGFPFKDEFLFTNIESSLTLSDVEIKKQEDVNRLKEFISNHMEITCYFALEYSICTLVKRALHELKIPENKVSVVTFDYISDPHVFTNTAYIKQYEDEIGFHSVRLLINELNGDNNIVKMYLPTEFVNSKSISHVKPLSSSNEDKKGTN